MKQGLVYICDKCRTESIIINECNHNPISGSNTQRWEGIPMTTFFASDRLDLCDTCFRDEITKLIKRIKDK